MAKSLVIFQAGKSGKKFFWSVSVSMEKEKKYPDLIVQVWNFTF